MHTPDPNINLNIGVDLSDRAAIDKIATDAAAEAAAQRDEAEKLAYARAWDRMVQRAAKGIIPRPQRHASMRRAAARTERERRAEAGE